MPARFSVTYPRRCRISRCRGVIRLIVVPPPERLAGRGLLGPICVPRGRALLGIRNALTLLVRRFTVRGGASFLMHAVPVPD